MRLAPVLIVYLFVLVGRAVGGCPDVDFTAFDTAPAMVDSFPVDSWEARDVGFSGAITVDVYVRADGTVCDARPRGESIRDNMGSIVASAAWSSRFLPAKRDGRSVPGIATITYEFEPFETRSAAAVLDTIPPMISDRAEVVGLSAWWCPGQIPAFVYYGVTIYGDMSLRDFEAVHKLASEDLEESHFIGRIYHYLVYPAECEPGLKFGGDRADVGVEYWRRVDDGVAIGSPCETRFFVNDGGAYRLFPIVTKTTACPSVRSEDDD